MAESIHADAVLDVRGLTCPMPVLRTKKALAKLAAGQVLLVESTDPHSVPDLLDFARQTGHALLGQQSGEGLYRHWIRHR